MLLCWRRMSKSWIFITTKRNYMANMCLQLHVLISIPPTHIHINKVDTNIKIANKECHRISVDIDEKNSILSRAKNDDRPTRWPKWFFFIFVTSNMVAIPTGDHNEMVSARILSEKHQCCKTMLHIVCWVWDIIFMFYTVAREFDWMCIIVDSQFTRLTDVSTMSGFESSVWYFV